MEGYEETWMGNKEHTGHAYTHFKKCVQMKQRAADHLPAKLVQDMEDKVSWRHMKR